jgi:anti-sigma B factor antagonist
LKIRTERKGGIATVTVEGEVDAAEREEVGRAIRGLLDDGAARIVFDFEKVTYVGSAGIGCLIEARKQALVRHGGVALVKPGHNLKKVIHDLGFDAAFPVYASREEAETALAAAGPAAKGPPPTGSSPRRR